MHTERKMISIIYNGLIAIEALKMRPREKRSREKRSGVWGLKTLDFTDSLILDSIVLLLLASLFNTNDRKKNVKRLGVRNSFNFFCRSIRLDISNKQTGSGNRTRDEEKIRKN